MCLALLFGSPTFSSLAPAELDAFWAHIIDAHATGRVDYDGCLKALGEPLCEVAEL